MPWAQLLDLITQQVKLDTTTSLVIITGLSRSTR